MPFYKNLVPDLAAELNRYGLQAEFEKTRDRVVDRLRTLRDRIHSQIPQKTLSETLLLATWNVREFDSEKYGPRTTESYYYIAEILSAFDLIAVQEVRDNLNALDRVRQIMGSHWDFLVTDVTEGPSGNGERLTFLYNTHKVRHTGLAGEIVLPQPKNGKSVVQFARSPFVCGFQAHWCKFSLCTVHIYYGKSVSVDQRRKDEIENLAKFFQDRINGIRRNKLGQSYGAGIEPENLVLLGDFNIFNRKDATYTALTSNGFTIPAQLEKLPGSNSDQTKVYDQIAFASKPERFEFTGRAGVFNFNEVVFRDDDVAQYEPLMQSAYAFSQRLASKKPIPDKNLKKADYRQWRTFQMSDHYPLWVELRVDFSDSYLRRQMTRQADGRYAANS